MVSPIFLPIAHAKALIQTLGWLVLDIACKQHPYSRTISYSGNATACHVAFYLYAISVLYYS